MVRLPRVDAGEYRSIGRTLRVLRQNGTVTEPTTPRPAHELIARAREQLAGTPTEALGDWVTNRRLLGFGRAPRIVRVGEAWHLGMLLIAPEALYQTGEILRAREDAVRGYTAQAQRERSERAAAAYRGGFAEGEAVHLDWLPIDLDLVDSGAESGPLSVVDGVVTLRWSAHGAPRPLSDYLDDQLALR